MTAWPVRRALRGDLGRSMREGSYTPRQIARALRQYADALEAAADRADEDADTEAVLYAALDSMGKVEHL